MSFGKFGFGEKLIEGIEAMGYQVPTPIQEQAIPVILDGKDLIGSAQTGTGKTAAFLLPLVHKIITTPAKNGIGALVIVPTRELAVQIDQHLQGLSYFTEISSIPVYGGTDGVSFGREQVALKQGVDIVICTPGRMISHLAMDYVNIGELQWLVLDEADRMLDMGFYDDIVKIISYLPEKRQTLMFSATMPQKIRQLAHKVLRHPVELNIAVSKPVERILQAAYVVYDKQKIPLVKDLLKGKNVSCILIFCSTKSATKSLSSVLKKAGLSVEAIHSDLEQSEREKVLAMFKGRRIQVLVATDILSRGIDIEDIDLIINYDVPNDGEDYIHRIGRTARAEADGVAITLVNEKEQKRFSEIERMLGKEIYKTPVPAEYGEVPVYNPSENKERRTRKPFRRKK